VLRTRRLVQLLRLAGARSASALVGTGWTEEATGADSFASTTEGAEEQRACAWPGGGATRRRPHSRVGSRQVAQDLPCTGGESAPSTLCDREQDREPGAACGAPAGKHGTPFCVPAKEQ
jgi:hypothetical protein